VDSTADLPQGLLDHPNVTMVPLTVYFGEHAYLDWVELKPEQFYEKLKSATALPKTSQPPLGIWLNLYRELRKQYERVYSVHLSAEFSGTFATASMAAAEVGGVKVIDSRSATGAIALLVDRMVERLDRGVPVTDFDDYIAHFVAHNTLLFLATTLEYLYKGGRIGRARHLAGTVLNIRPILTITDGVADVYKKARGLRQALEVMRGGLLERTEPGSDVFVNFSHGLNLPVMERLEALILAIPDRTIHLRPPSIVGSVIGTYIGPGAVGMAFIQE
jgi:DegV family protein with EDD domain